MTLPYLSQRHLFALALFAVAAPAHAVRVSIAGASGFSGVAVSSTDATQGDDLDSDGSAGFGLGAFLEMPIGDRFGVGSGLVYFQRRFDISNATYKVERSAPSLFVPLEGRVWFGDTLAASAGFFAGVNVGDASDTYVLGNSALGTFSAKQRNLLEYGMTFAFDLNFVIAGKNGIFLQGRYNHGLSDAASDSSFSEKIRDVWGLVGLRIELP